jgi:hypothetical protein
VIPAVPEVVFVEEAVSRCSQRLVQPYVGLRGPLVTLLEVVLGEEALRLVVPLRSHLEGVEVRFGPAHGRLKDGVHSIQRQVAGKLDTPPDARRGAIQVDPDRVAGDALPARQ